MSQPTQFCVNDIVEAFGCRGVVTEGDEYEDYPVRVVFTNEHEEYFTADGREVDWHQTPSLKLIERPKRKVTKTVERWVNVYYYGIPEQFFFSKEAAYENRDKFDVHIACVKLVGTYEVEEDV